MKRHFLLFLLSIASLLYAKESEGISQDSLLKQNAQIVSLAANELSKTLPKQIDKYTTLVAIEAKQNNLLYVFEINTAPKSDEEVIKSSKKRMQDAVIQGVCTTQDRFLQAGISISYLYKSAASHSNLFRFDITKTDCLALQH